MLAIGGSPFGSTRTGWVLCPGLGTSPSATFFAVDVVCEFSFAVFAHGYGSWIPASAGIT